MRSCAACVSMLLFVAVIYCSLLAALLYVQVYMLTSTQSVLEDTRLKLTEVDVFYDSSRMRYSQVTTDVKHNITLNVLEAGFDNKQHKKLIVLLHGFPDTALLTFHHQIKCLIEHDFYVVAPDMRGFNKSSAPEQVDRYSAVEMAEDIKHLITVFAGKKAAYSLIVHDLGSLPGWIFAVKYPTLLQSFVLSNSASGTGFAELLMKNPKAFLQQQIRSTYITLFQLPYIPERIILGVDPEPLSVEARYQACLRSIFLRLYTVYSKKTSISLPMIKNICEQVMIPGRMSTMIRAYKSIVRSLVLGSIKHVIGTTDAHTEFLSLSYANITVPSLVIWGLKDITLQPELAEIVVSKMDQGKLIYYPETSHWPPYDNPERFNSDLLAFFAEQLKFKRSASQVRNIVVDTPAQESSDPTLSKTDKQVKETNEKRRKIEDEMKAELYEKITKITGNKNLKSSEDHVNLTEN